VLILLIATTNAGKIREIQDLLAGVPFALTTTMAWPGVAAPEETGSTFEENARQKALYYAAATAQLTVAEDSGLEIDALGGRPGIESARFGGVHASYPEKFRLIYDALREEHLQTSTARFVCALAVADRNRIVFEALGTIEGSIAPEPKGEGGFGYDPIFFYPPFGATLAQVAGRKRDVSHRARAFQALRSFLEGTGGSIR